MSFCIESRILTIGSISWSTFKIESSSDIICCSLLYPSTTDESVGLLLEDDAASFRFHVFRHRKKKSEILNTKSFFFWDNEIVDATIQSLKNYPITGYWPQKIGINII